MTGRNVLERQIPSMTFPSVRLFSTLTLNDGDSHASSAGGTFLSKRKIAIRSECVDKIRGNRLENRTRLPDNMAADGDFDCNSWPHYCAFKYPVIHLPQHYFSCHMTSLDWSDVYKDH